VRGSATVLPTLLAAGTVVASAGAVAAAVIGTALAGVAVGTALAHFMDRRHADWLQGQIDRGGILLWVRTPDAAAEPGRSRSSPARRPRHPRPRDPGPGLSLSGTVAVAADLRRRDQRRQRRGQARLGAAGAEVLPWRNMLHDGPVPAGLPLPELSALHARWLADHLDLDPAGTDAAFRERGARLAAVPPGVEVEVCVEHDLYDQLQLLQILAELAPRAGEVRLSLAQADNYLGPQEPTALAALVRDRRPVEADVLAIAREAWDAFRAPTPEAVARKAGRSFPGLPWLAPALGRLLEELPDSAGLTRTERTIPAVSGRRPR
jgi:hypothetical protein